MKPPADARRLIFQLQPTKFLFMSNPIQGGQKAYAAVFGRIHDGLFYGRVRLFLGGLRAFVAIAAATIIVIGLWLLILVFGLIVIVIIVVIIVLVLAAVFTMV